MSIAERFACLLPTDENSEVGERLFQLCREALPFEEDAALPSVFDLYGRDEHDLKRLLSRPVNSLAATADCPDWCMNLTSALESAGNVAIDRSDQPAKLEPRLLPLLHMADPLTAWFRSQLAAAPKDRFPNIGDLFEPHLELRLFQCLLPSLLHELRAQRVAGTLSGDTPEARFISFCTSLTLKAVRAAFYARYPVVGRQAATLSADAAASATELSERLGHDWTELAAAGLVRSSDAEIDHLNFAGDAHAGGRAVVVITFTSGSKLIYKPRAVQIEARFQSLLTQINRAQALQFRTIRVIDKEAYGWCEFVDGEPLKDMAAARRFYERQGGLLALLHLLAAVDFHAENIIAGGEHPVLVDLETLFTSPFRQVAASDENQAAQYSFYLPFTTDSLARIGVLPARRMARGNAPGVDVSGLTGRSGQTLPIKAIGLRDVGTDDMHIALQRVETFFDANRPSLDGEPLVAHDFVDELAAGFRSTYQTVLRCREDWLKDSGALAAFKNVRARILLRPTMQYSTLLASMTQPQCVTDGREFDFRLDRFLASGPAWEGAATVALAERADLWRRDIPAFSTRVGSRDLISTAGEVVRDFLDSDGLTLVQCRVGAADPRRADVGAWYVKQAVECAQANESLAAAQMIDPVRFPRRRTAQPACLVEGLQAEAVALAERIAHLRLEEGGSVLWTAVRDTDEATHLELMQYELYGGLSGIALFFAYLGNSTNETRWTEFARVATTTARTMVGFSRAADRLGAFSGLSGYVYLLTHLGVLWRQSELIDEALGLLNRIEALIDRDESFDIISGAAGAILVLLGLAHVAQTESPVDLARALGRHLLNTSDRHATGLCWANADIGGARLTGFGHGAAGIAYALLQLHAATGEEQYREASLAAVRYERAVFDDVNHDWPDHRVGGDARGRRPGWCHGAAGIGAARARMALLDVDPGFDGEIRAAATATIQRGFGFTHSLCHGDVGNLELLTVMADAGAVSCDTLRMLRRQVLDDIRVGGYKTGVAHGVDCFDLMRGAAGIGLGLLRQTKLTSVPSVLLLDPPIMSTGEL